jgi:AraC family transcriptional regulator
MRHVDVAIKLVEPGLCDSPPHVDHRLSIHVGKPVASVCWEGRPRPRYVRTPGGINIVPAGAQSRWWIESPMKQLYVTVPYKSFASAALDLGLDPAAVQLEARHQVRDARLEHIGHALRLETAEGSPNGLLFSESLGVALCIQLVRAFARRPQIESPRRVTLAPVQSVRVAEYIDEHLGSRNLSLKELSEIAGTSVSYFKTAFRKTFGRPAHRYVVERRVERAARLLAQGAPISYVAAEVGFAHPSHMARWMQRLLGATPRQLRRRER